MARTLRAEYDKPGHQFFRRSCPTPVDPLPLQARLIPRHALRQFDVEVVFVRPETPPKPPPRTGFENEFNSRPERLEHTFAEEHKLEGVVERAGGREQAMRQMLEGLRGHVPDQGTFESVINVSGENVTVRGFVDNGVIKIGTAFIP